MKAFLTKRFIFQCSTYIYNYQYKGKPLDSVLLFHQKLFRQTNMEMRLTNSVDVVLAVVRIVVVDDKLDIVDVEASGGDVCGDEDGGAARLELAQNPFPFLLLLVAVDAHRWPTVFPHQPIKNSM